MCGRFVQFSNIDQLEISFPIDEVRCEISPNYNAAPTQKIPVIFRLDELNVLDRLHWGLVPHWAKDVSIGAKMINARGETVASKPSFRAAFKKRRCLIPADGFYEWKGPKGDKQPLLITLPNEEPFAFAGLWEFWRDKNDPENTYGSCTIITRDASKNIEKIHDRMPAVLTPDAYAVWLDVDNQNAEQLQKVLAEKTETEFTFRPVSKHVNSVSNNDPSNIFV